LKFLEANGSFWLKYGNFHINTYFFRRGILILSALLPIAERTSVTSYSFKINQREFFFYNPVASAPNQPLPDAKSLKKTSQLLTALTTFADRRGLVAPIAGKPITLFNKNRREEIFLPMVFKSEKNFLGIYIYPWISKPSRKLPEFQGFSQFVTAGCMFGASLQAITTKGCEIEFINHQIRLERGEKIIGVYHDAEELSPFELSLFNELERNCLLIKSLTREGCVPFLMYHLPVFDYLLFGLKLFLNDQITESALKDFVELVWKRKTLYKKIINDICSKHSINASICSPFDNLLLALNDDDPYASLANQLNLLEFTLLENKEHTFLQACIHRLVSNEYELPLRDIWVSVLEQQIEEIDTLEQLFKLGNTILLAHVSRGKKDYDTCSLLPLSEKQIQVHYAQVSEQLEIKQDQYLYPAIFNITTMESIIAYSPTTNGLLFYYNSSTKLLSKLLEDRNLFLHTSKNLGFFALNPDKNTPECEQPTFLEKQIFQANSAS
jgi:hypothetical protein